MEALVPEVKYLSKLESQELAPIYVLVGVVKLHCKFMLSGCLDMNYWVVGIVALLQHLYGNFLVVYDVVISTTCQW